MKIALIADALTSKALELEADVWHLTPQNAKIVLRFWKPDILFVESAWQGHKNRWKYKIAAYPEHKNRHNKKLTSVVAFAKNIGIPTLFWNKEDGVHFNRFINSAKLFEHIFTVDENCIPKYKNVVENHVSVNTLMFAVQPSIHHFTGFHFKSNHANFIGSYSQHIHPERKKWQDMIFEASCEAGMGLEVWDRNSGRKSSDYRYPQSPCIKVHKSIDYIDTSKVYKEYSISLNVNTIVNSPTMFSRRLIEILACGGIAVTNNAPSVEKYFKDYCHVVSNKQEALELFSRLKDGPSERDLKRAEAGAAYVAKEHTWKQRLEQICEVVGIDNA